MRAPLAEGHVPWDGSAYFEEGRDALDGDSLKKLELDEKGNITNDPKVNEMAWREPHKGWGALKTEI